MYLAFFLVESCVVLCHCDGHTFIRSMPCLSVRCCWKLQQNLFWTTLLIIFCKSLIIICTVIACVLITACMHGTVVLSSFYHPSVWRIWCCFKKPRSTWFWLLNNINYIHALNDIQNTTEHAYVYTVLLCVCMQIVLWSVIYPAVTCKGCGHACVQVQKSTMQCSLHARKCTFNLWKSLLNWIIVQWIQW